MSVEQDFRVETRPYSGYEDPGLPFAAWVASGELTGDGSGGFVRITFQFQVAESDNVTERYNLEQFHADVQLATNSVAIMVFQGMDHTSFPFRPMARQEFALGLQTNGVLDSSVQLRDLAGLPLWMGMPIPGVSAGLEFQFVNLDGVLFTASGQGYIWGPRAILAPGGPRRPPNGFFR